MANVIRGKIIHVAKMATKDESSVDVDFAVCPYKEECLSLKLSCKDIAGSMILRANES